MARISFPASPTVGQQYVQNGSAWTWDGVKWVKTAPEITQIPTASYVPMTGSGVLINYSNGIIQLTASGVTSIDNLQDVTTRGGSSSSSISLTGPVTASNLRATGSLFGTASWAQNAISTSYALSSSYAVSASRAITASYALTSSVAVSASYALSSSYAVSASRTVSSSYAATASIAISSSYALSASIAVTSSYALTASVAMNAISSSYALSSSYSLTATTASFADSIKIGNGLGATLNNTLNGVEVTASVRTVNGSNPTPNGNVATALTAVYTGDSGSFQVSKSLAAFTGSLSIGSVWVFAGSTGSASGSNGTAYIYTTGSTGVGEWYELGSADIAQYDARYLMLAGTNSPMQGDVNWGGYKITNLAPGANSNDAINLGQLTSSLLSYVLTSSFNTWTGSLTSTFNGTSRLALTSSTAITASYVATASYVPTLQEVTTAGNQTTNEVHITASFTNGTGNLAVGDSSHAEGFSTEAVGSYAHAEGKQTTALGNGSHAEGELTTALNGYSHTEGQGTIASADFQHVEGTWNLEDANALWVVGDGTDNATRSNVIAAYTGKVTVSGSLVTSDPSGVVGGTNLVHLVPGTNVTITSGSAGYVISASSVGSQNLQDVTTVGNRTTSSVFFYPTSSWLGGKTILSASIRANSPLAATEEGAGFYLTSTQTVDSINTDFRIDADSALFQFYGERPNTSSIELTVDLGNTDITNRVGFDLAPNQPYGYTQVRFDEIRLLLGDVVDDVVALIMQSSSRTVSVTGSLKTFDPTGVIGGSNLVHIKPGTNITVTSGSAGYIINAVGGGGSQNLQQVTTVGNQTSASVYITGSLTNGEGVLAVGNYSHAEGRSTTAVDIYTHAEGESTVAYGSYSHAEGYLTVSSGSYSHTEGNRTVADGMSSHAEGLTTTALGDYSHAEGEATTAVGLGSHAEGERTTAMGDYTHTEGINTIAEGAYAHAEGANTTAAGVNSHAEGLETTAVGSYSHVEGYYNKALGDYSHAEGGWFVPAAGNIAYGIGSHAEGVYAVASGSWSHAEGTTCMAKGEASHAEGQASTAIGNYSHAEGFNTRAIGVNSHAEGQATTSIGSYSHAEGSSTTAVGLNSHAGGFNTISNGQYQTVVGQYNATFDSQSAFVVGAGTVATRKNGLSIYVSGSANTVIVQMENLPTTGVGLPAGALFTTGSVIAPGGVKIVCMV